MKFQFLRYLYQAATYIHGTKDDTGIGTEGATVAAECLTIYMNGFQERNPNFRVFNAVLHMDEATPHLHIEFLLGITSKGLIHRTGLHRR